MLDSPLLITLACFALLLAGFGFLHLQSDLSRKVGLITLCVASALGVWAWTQSWWCTFAVMLLWIIVPLLELVLLLRRLRLPRRRQLRDADVPTQDRAQLEGLTEDMRDLGFSQVDECEPNPAVHEQYFRLFVHPNHAIHGGLGWVAIEGVGFLFVCFTSEDNSGKVWLTWDYPLMYGLKFPPEINLHRALFCENVEELLQEHQDFLDLNLQKSDLVGTEISRAAARARLEKIFTLQLDYNVQQGILSPAPGEEEDFRYSWRGAAYVVGQFLRHMVRP